MNAEMIMGLVIISIVAVIMVIIGISQFNKKENPVGFSRHWIMHIEAANRIKEKLLDK